MSLLAEDSEYAFQLIYDRHRNLIYKLSIRYLKSPIMAQEVVQDVFLKLWMERKTFKKEYTLEAWLRTVTRNHLLNHLKKIANEWKALDHLRHISPEADQSFLLTGEATHNPQQEQLNQAVGSLPEKQRYIYLLAKQENLSYLDIAKKLSLSPLTVKTHMARALRQIKLLLQTGITPVIAYFFQN